VRGYSRRQVRPPEAGRGSCLRSQPEWGELGTKRDSIRRLSTAFAEVEEKPDFMVGVNILKFGPAFTSGPGNGVHLHMYVNDKRTVRKVELVAQHGMTDSGLAAKLVRRFLDSFQTADSGLTVTQGNV
jgi:hypothetical protein